MGVPADELQEGVKSCEMPVTQAKVPGLLRQDPLMGD